MSTNWGLSEKTNSPFDRTRRVLFDTVVFQVDTGHGTNISHDT